MAKDMLLQFGVFAPVAMQTHFPAVRLVIRTLDYFTLRYWHVCICHAVVFFGSHKNNKIVNISVDMNAVCTTAKDSEKKRKNKLENRQDIIPR